MRIRRVIRIVMPLSGNILANIQNALRKRSPSGCAGTTGETCLRPSFKAAGRKKKYSSKVNAIAPKVVWKAGVMFGIYELRVPDEQLWWSISPLNSRIHRQSSQNYRGCLETLQGTSIPLAAFSRSEEINIFFWKQHDNLTFTVFLVWDFKGSFPPRLASLCLFFVVGKLKSEQI